jgi:aromatic-L-amino-acid/L-tryptophan decarboxylase
MIVENPPTGVNGSDSPLAMDAETMRALGYQAVDALVERWTQLREEAPWAGATRSELDARALFGEDPPEDPLPPERVLEETVSEVLGVAARVDHPRFMAYIPSAPTWPSVVADLLASGFNTFQGTWQGAAGPARIELQVLEWFRDWLGMPGGSSGLFTSGGSMANALAVVAAREAARDRAREGAREGASEGAGDAARDPAEPDGGFRPCIFLSDQGHASLVRAARVAGIDPEGIRVLPSGDDLRLHPDTVTRGVAEARAEGWTPILVAANAGATNTGIVDPLAGLAEACRAAGVHFHVDAAYGGFAVLDPRGAQALEGIGEADSVTLDPHKWLFQPFECGCLLVRDPRLLLRAFHQAPEYMQDTRLGEEAVNFAERGVQLTRSFRALKVWMSVRTLGLGAFREAVGRGITLAAWAEARLRQSPVLEVVTPASLGIVTWRVRPEHVPPAPVVGDARGAPPATAAPATPAEAGSPAPTAEAGVAALHRRIQATLVREEVAFLSSTLLRGEDVLRFCILNPAVTEADLEAAIAVAERVVAEAR